MRLTDIQEHNITSEECDRIYQYEDGLSDFCENTEGGWGVEWDGIYGRHWNHFDTKEEAEASLDRHSDRCLALLPQVREELAEEAAAKLQANIDKGRKIAAEKRAIKEAKTIGGQCPELAKLLTQMRNERKSA